MIKNSSCTNLLISWIVCFLTCNSVFQSDFEKEDKSHLDEHPCDAHSQDSFPNFFCCLHFKADLSRSGKSLTGTDIDLRFGIQMAEAILCGFQVVKNHGSCKWQDVNSFNIHLGSEIEHNLKSEIGTQMCLLMERHQALG